MSTPPSKLLQANSSFIFLSLIHEMNSFIHSPTTSTKGLPTAKPDLTWEYIYSSMHF